MNLRSYLFSRGLALAAVAPLLIAAPLFQKMDGVLLYLVPGFGVFCGWRAWRCFKGASRAREQDRPFGPPTDAPANVQRTHYKRMMILAAIVFPILGVTAATQLKSLEDGSQKKVQLIAPAGMVYRAAGYWPAVLVHPLLGVLACAILWKKFKAVPE